MRSNGYEEYRRLEEKLIHLRWINRGSDSRDEDIILAAMEDAWSRLSEAEKAEIDAEPPRSLIRFRPAYGSRIQQDIDVFCARRAPVRIFREVA